MVKKPVKAASSMVNDKNQKEPNRTILAKRTRIRVGVEAGTLFVESRARGEATGEEARRRERVKRA